MTAQGTFESVAVVDFRAHALPKPKQVAGGALTVRLSYAWTPRGAEVSVDVAESKVLISFIYPVASKEPTVKRALGHSGFARVGQNSGRLLELVVMPFADGPSLANQDEIREHLLRSSGLLMTRLAADAMPGQQLSYDFAHAGLLADPNWAQRVSARLSQSSNGDP